MVVTVPYGKGHWQVEIESKRVNGILNPKTERLPCTEREIIWEAMRRPVGSPPLAELARGKKKIVIIASDHTRAVPSRIIAPLLLTEIRSANPKAEISFLVATGFHRGTSKSELIEKFGDDIVQNEQITVHNAFDHAALTDAGSLPSGGGLIINRLAMEADLLIAEGLIEPHLFAGFSGGRKSVLPGIASEETVLANHCAEFISHPCSRPGNLKGNQIHRDMLYAARRVGLAYILNVVLDERKQVIFAVAGDMEQAHVAGCRFALRRFGLEPALADIVITTNGGYPLDQNVYQHVKALTTAEATINPGGVIIVCAELSDGHGSRCMYQAMRSNIRETLQRIHSTPRNATIPDQWVIQILIRILLKHRIIFATADGDAKMLLEMGIEVAPTLEAAMEIAEGILGSEATVTIVPDGATIVIGPKDEADWEGG